MGSAGQQTSLDTACALLQAAAQEVEDESEVSSLPRSLAFPCSASEDVRGAAERRAGARAVRQGLRKAAPALPSAQDQGRKAVGAGPEPGAGPAAGPDLLANLRRHAPTTQPADPAPSGRRLPPVRPVHLPRGHGRGLSALGPTVIAFFGGTVRHLSSGRNLKRLVFWPSYGFFRPLTLCSGRKSLKNDRNLNLIGF